MSNDFKKKIRFDLVKNDEKKNIFSMQTHHVFENGPSQVKAMPNQPKRERITIN